MQQIALRHEFGGISPYVLTLREELRVGSMKRRGRFKLSDTEVEVCEGRESIWAIIRRDGRGGLALRTAHIGGADFSCRKTDADEGEILGLCLATVRLIRLPRRKLGKASIVTAGGDTIRPFASNHDRVDYRVPADGRFILTWQ